MSNYNSNYGQQPQQPPPGSGYGYGQGAPAPPPPGPEQVGTPGYQQQQPEGYPMNPMNSVPSAMGGIPQQQQPGMMGYPPQNAQPMSVPPMPGHQMPGPPMPSHPMSGPPMPGAPTPQIHGPPMPQIPNPGMAPQMSAPPMPQIPSPQMAPQMPQIPGPPLSGMPGMPAAQPYPTASYPSPMQHPRLPGTPPMNAAPYQVQPMQQPQKAMSLPVPITLQSPLEDLQRVPAMPTILPANATDFCRCTLTRIPRNHAIASKTKLSFGLTVTPFPYGTEEESVPVAADSANILRCSRCRTYLNPYAEVLDSGSRWKCNLCYVVNDFPSSYDYDPQTQQHFDRRARPELNCPVYDFVAPQEYMVRAPQPPAYLFLLDATHAAVSSGMFATAVRTILDSLDSLPNTEGRTLVSFVTFDSALQFYSFTPGGGDARMLVVADTSEPFLPSDAQDLLVPLAEYREAIERFLTALPAWFASTQQASSALGPALASAIKLLSGVGGKIVLLQASPASLGEGALKVRDEAKLLGSSGESALLRAQSSFYKMQATECSRVQVCIDLFSCPPPGVPSLDLATLGTAARFTGGKVFYYPGFNATRPEDAAKLAGDLATFLARPVSFEAVIRIRASQGLSVNAYHGAFFLRSSDLLALPNVNPDHSYTAQVVLEDNLTAPRICFQTAVLHTTCHGERRIRVINAAYPVTDLPEDVFEGVDLGATVDLLSKMALEKIMTNSLEDARDALGNKMIEVAKAVHAHYRLSASGQLMLPESLRLMPSLIHALLRSPAFRGGATTPCDLRSYYISLMRTLSVPQTLDLVQPLFFAMHSLDPAAGLPHPETGRIVLPARMPLSSERLERHGLYVVDNGLMTLIWLGSQCHPELCSLIFGTPSVASLPAGKFALPRLENAWSHRLQNILAKRRSTQPYPPVTYLIKEEDGPNADPSLKMLFLSQLVEDRAVDGQQASYAQWLSTVREKSVA